MVMRDDHRSPDVTRTAEGCRFTTAPTPPSHLSTSKYDRYEAGLLPAAIPVLLYNSTTGALEAIGDVVYAQCVDVAGNTGVRVGRAERNLWSEVVKRAEARVLAEFSAVINPQRQAASYASGRGVVTRALGARADQLVDIPAQWERFTIERVAGRQFS